MSTIVTDTITGKSTATTITIGSTPVVSASANSMTIRGEGSNQTSIQQGLAKALCHVSADGTTASATFNISSLDDDGTGDRGINFSTNMGSATYIVTLTSEDAGTGALNRTCDVTDGTMATGAFDFECVMTNSSTNRTNSDTTNLACVHGDLA